MQATSSAAIAPTPPRSGTALDAVIAAASELRESLAPLGATNLAVFGSVARREEREDSDVDLLVDLESNVGLFALLRMRSIAEGILGREVDLIPRDGLKPDFAESVLDEAILL